MAVLETVPWSETCFCPSEDESICITRKFYLQDYEGQRHTRAPLRGHCPSPDVSDDEVHLSLELAYEKSKNGPINPAKDVKGCHRLALR